MRSSRRQIVVTCAVAIAVAVNAAAQNPLTAARELYSAAAYEDALKLLNGLRGPEQRGAEDGHIIEQYRAFCLLALGRNAEAESAIESLVRAAPFYHPTDADLSPHVRDTFHEVRRRTLPSVIQATYEVGKAEFDRKDPGAADTFRLVLDLTADPDLGALRNRSPVSELRTLAAGLLALSTAPPPTLQPPPQQPAPQQSPPQQAPPQVTPTAPAAATPIHPPMPVAPPAPTGNRIYGPDDANVVPPVVVRQSFAPLAEVFAVRPGIVEVTVDESGEVIAVKTIVAVNAVYDRIAIATARSWRYRPATLDGRPVKFRALVQLQQRPR
jgi:TonB-like protein